MYMWNLISVQYNDSVIILHVASWYLHQKYVMYVLKG